MFLARLLCEAANLGSGRATAPAVTITPLARSMASPVETLWAAVVHHLGGDTVPAVCWLDAVSSSVAAYATDACEWFEGNGSPLARWLVVLNVAVGAMARDYEELRVTNARLRAQMARDEGGLVLLGLSMGCQAEFCLATLHGEHVEIWGHLAHANGGVTAWLTMVSCGDFLGAATYETLARNFESSTNILRHLDQPVAWLNAVSLTSSPRVVHHSRVDAVIDEWYATCTALKMDNVAYSQAPGSSLPVFRLHQKRQGTYWVGVD
jgi:hypothetical protein